LQIETAVHFLGRIPHRQLLNSGLYRDARALVTAAETENQPMSLLEAMACGTPVIAPAVESMEELIDGSGRLFPAGDSTAMAAEMVRLAHDHRLHADCSRRAAERALRFDAEEVAQLHERVFREAVSGSGLDRWDRGRV